MYGSKTRLLTVEPVLGIIGPLERFLISLERVDYHNRPEKLFRHQNGTFGHA